MNQYEMFGAAQWVCAGQYACPYARQGTQQLDTDGVPHFPILRSRFRAEAGCRAMLRVVGLGFFHCYINGKAVSRDRFLPLSTDYEDRPNHPAGEKLTGHRLYVPEYDVSDLLVPGENVLALHFGGGWYTFEWEGYYGDPKAIFRLQLTSGEKQWEIVSSPCDRIGDSYVKTYQFTCFENQDYRGFDQRVFQVDFDDSGWKHAVAAVPVETEYLFTDCPADREQEMLPLHCIAETETGRIYDTGRNCANLPVLKLTGKVGETVKVLFSEECTPDGAMRWGPEWGVQHTEFICDGTERVVQPMFTWFAYRYLSVSGPAEVIGARVIHTDVEVTAEFTSSNETLNWLYQAFLNTQLSNMHAGIPSDCPHLERRGYTGDGQLVCHAAMSVLDSRRFYRKWIDDIADCQDVYTGHVQYTAPYLNSGGGPGGWGCAIVEVPYQYYRHYGDIEPMKRLYPQMMRYFDYLELHSENGLVTSDQPGQWCLGDWCAPGVVALPAPFVNNYFYVRSLNRILEVAGKIGADNDVPLLLRRREERKRAMMAAYFNTWDGNFIGGFQGANAFAVDIGIGDERTYDHLVRRYEKLGHFDTGIFGTEVVSRVLFERGNGDLAVRLMISDDTKSFAGMRRAGATTLWEYWPEEPADRSHNHPMFGAVVAHLFDYLLGISQQTGTAGYRDIVIRPHPTALLQRAEGVRELPIGRVHVCWEIVGVETEVTVTLPAGVRARIELGDFSAPLDAGENHFRLKRNSAETR